MKNLFYTIAAFILFTSIIFSQPDTLTILHVNDSHSTLEAIGPRDANLKGTLGGISRVATLVGMTKMTEPNVLFLHAGDISIGDVFFNRNFHVPELQILSALGVDAMTLGNHEFDLGPEALLGSISYTFPDPADAFPILTANVDFSDPTIAALQNYVDAYTIKEFGDLKVGIFGLTTPATNLLSNPSPAVVSDDIVTIAATMVGTLRTVENCDVVIFLSHLGVALDQAIVSYVPGINVIVGGHDHYKYEEPITMTDPMGGITWIVQARSNYMYAGEMKLVVDGTDVQLLNYQLIPIDENIPQEPNVQAIVDGMIEEIETFYGIPFFSQPFGNATAFFEEEAKDLLMLGAHDTPLGNLVADAFRSYTSTDIALQAGGSIALPLWEGTFTAGDLFRANGYGFNTTNTLGFQLATFDLTGMDILTGLTFGLSEIEMNDEFLIQVSGMEYTYDGTKPAEERLVSVKINGMPIDPTATYSVTANEMVLGILAFIGIVPSNVNILTGVTEFEALSNYTITLQNVLSPSTSGRVSNVNNPVPVELISFTANSVDDFVKLIWITATELNNHGFEIQRRVAESGFATIGFVRGEGTTTNHRDYFYLDKNLADGKYFYRLKQVDYNGSYEYSNVIEVDFRSLNEYALEQNYPNPFNPATTINYSIPEAGNVELKVYDILGNEVATLTNEVKAPGNYSAVFDASSLASEIYIYTLRANNFVQTKKMILMK
jgi:2',3'-cyclic-nucleotide 2'-phosphodiesterase (5'-nucleotidase family)